MIDELIRLGHYLMYLLLLLTDIINTGLVYLILITK